VGKVGIIKQTRYGNKLIKEDLPYCSINCCGNMLLCAQASWRYKVCGEYGLKNYNVRLVGEQSDAVAKIVCFLDHNLYVKEYIIIPVYT